MMKFKKINLYIKKGKLIIHVNRSMDFLKFNKMFFFKTIFFNYMIKKKLDNHTIEFN
jgi:hypothetical protein